MEGDIETRARDMGWIPQEEFRGDPSKWRPAEEFVERGETLLPIVKANTRKLEQALQTQKAETARLAQMFKASQESIVELQSVHAETLQIQLARQREELLGQIQQARDDGDVRAEMDLHDRLAELRETPKPAAKPVPEPETPGLDPDFAAWQKENPWFGTDTRKTQLANGIAQQLRADPENDSVQGADFFALVSQALEERAAGGRGAPVSKVAGGRASGGGGSSAGAGSQGYTALPSEAREACDSRVRKMVGEGKPFKDAASWQAYYAKIYFKGEA